MRRLLPLGALAGLAAAVLLPLAQAAPDPSICPLCGGSFDDYRALVVTVVEVQVQAILTFLVG